MQQRRATSPLFVGLLLAAVFAGCAGEPGPNGHFVDTESATPTPSNDPVTDGPAPTTAPPSSSDKPVQTGSQVKVDPNATFVGSAHTHDWWAGDTQYVIHDKTYQGGPGNVCVGGTTFACTGGPDIIRFESSADPHSRPNNVWPGTSKMTIRVVTSAVYQPFMVEASGPGGYTWAKNRYAVTTANHVITLDNLGENNTDPPHFRGSGWTLRLTKGPQGSLFTGPIRVEVTIFKGRDPPLDPPHPDLWEGGSHRVLGEIRTYANWTRIPVANGDRGDGWANDGYGQGPNHGIPRKYPLAENATVTIATGKMRVTMKWSNSETALASKPGLRYCTANQDCGTSSAIWHLPPVTQDSATQRVYEFEVRPDQWDSPYILKSKWAYSWYFDDPQGLTIGNFKGHIDWTIEIFKVEG